MSQKSTVKIFIASSAELKNERDKCLQQIVDVNKSHKHLQLEPVLWEYDTVKGNQVGYKNIQDAINPKLKESDLVIFIFYSKIGQYTREEFEYATKENKKLFVFFKEGFSPDRSSIKNYGELLDFKEGLNHTVLYSSYKDLSDFGDQLYRNLNLYLFENHKPRKTASREDKVNINIEKTAKDERKRTEKIILASQPLKQLELSWEFFKVNNSIVESISNSSNELLEDYNMAFYSVPMRADDYKFLNSFYKLYPFLYSISEIELNNKNDQDASQLKNVVALISLDNMHDAILPIGVISEDITNLQNNTKSTDSDLLYSGGIRFHEDLDEFWGQHYGMTKVMRSKTIHDQPTLELDDDKISISWLLDQTTILNSVDRQSQNVVITANMPSQIEILIFSQIEQLPFSSKNFSIAEDCYPWRINEYPGYEIAFEKFTSSSISLIPNGLVDQTVRYHLKTITKYQIQNFWGDEIPCESLRLFYNPAND